LGSGKRTPSPLASWTFEAELLKQDAGPACGSRLSRDTLLDGRLTRKNNRSTGSPSAEQSSVLGSWLDFSIHHFRSDLLKPCLPDLRDFHPRLRTASPSAPVSSCSLFSGQGAGVFVGVGAAGVFVG